MADEMTNDGTQEQALDIAALLEDESAADTPIRVADLKPFLEQRTGRIVEEVSTRLRAEREQEERQRRDAEERNATLKSDMDWALDLDRRLSSSDESVRQQAVSEKEASADRYRRGLAIAYEHESSDRRNKAIAEHLSPLLENLKQAGEQEYLDALSKPEEIARHGGNWLLMAIKMGEERGYQRGKAEAADEADLDRRANEASSGAPRQSSPNNDPRGGRNDDLWEGIDRTKPGAFREFQRRLDARNAQTARR